MFHFTATSVTLCFGYLLDFAMAKSVTLHVIHVFMICTLTCKILYLYLLRKGKDPAPFGACHHFAQVSRVLVISFINTRTHTHTKIYLGSGDHCSF